MPVVNSVMVKLAMRLNTCKVWRGEMGPMKRVLKIVLIVIGVAIVSVLVFSTTPKNAVKLDIVTYGELDLAAKVNPQVQKYPSGSLKKGGLQYSISPYHFAGNVFEVNNALC